MSREWQPGDVAVWTDSTGETHRIFREGYGERGDMKARWFGAMCGEAWPEPFDDVRPLVVIDPEDREQVGMLVDAYVQNMPAKSGSGGPVLTMQAALREFAGPKPPKPDEPTGLGAVIETSDGRRYVRTAASVIPWLDADDRETGYEYADLDAVEILNEGVTP